MGLRFRSLGFRVFRVSGFLLYVVYRMEAASIIFVCFMLGFLSYCSFSYADHHYLIINVFTLGIAADFTVASFYHRYYKGAWVLFVVLLSSLLLLLSW